MSINHQEIIKQWDIVKKKVLSLQSTNQQLQTLFKETLINKVLTSLLTSEYLQTHPTLSSFYENKTNKEELWQANKDLWAFLMRKKTFSSNLTNLASYLNKPKITLNDDKETFINLLTTLQEEFPSLTQLFLNHQELSFITNTNN